VHNSDCAFLAEAHALLGAIAGTYDYDWSEADRDFCAAARRASIATRGPQPRYRFVGMRTNKVACDRIKAALCAKCAL
jgi:hypothetical protein